MTRECGAQIDYEILAEYWAGALPPEEEAGIEEHLMSCDACCERLREMMALAEGIRAIAREGAVRMVVSEEFLKCAAEAGLRVRQYAPPAGGSVECTVTVNDDLLIGRLAADLRGVSRVDLALCDETGAERARFADIPFNGARGEVILSESMDRVRAAGAEALVMKLLGVDERGERLIGSYRFNHTPS
jgi:hypothetical protein